MVGKAMDLLSIQIYPQISVLSWHPGIAHQPSNWCQRSDGMGRIRVCDVDPIKMLTCTVGDALTTRSMIFHMSLISKFDASVLGGSGAWRLGDTTPLMMTYFRSSIYP